MCMSVYVCVCVCMCVCVCTCTTGLQKSCCQVAVTPKRFKMATNVFGYSECHLLHVTFRAPRTLSLRWSLEFWKIYALLLYDIRIFCICMHACLHSCKYVFLYLFISLYFQSFPVINHEHSEGRLNVGLPSFLTFL
jgi:hypothetical protein